MDLGSAVGKFLTASQISSVEIGLLIAPLSSVVKLLRQFVFFKECPFHRTCKSTGTKSFRVLLHYILHFFNTFFLRSLVSAIRCSSLFLLS